MLRGAWQLTRSLLTLPAYRRELQQRAATDRTLDQHMATAFETGHGMLYIRPYQVPMEIRALLERLTAAPPQRVLEIGTSKGGTLYLFCRVATPTATLVTVDLPGAWLRGHYPRWKDGLYRSFAGPQQTVVTMRGDSHSAATARQVESCFGGQPIDFLFIDGDHSYEGVADDFERYRRLVRPDGLIAFHDIAPGPPESVGGVPQFWNDVKTNYRHVEFIEHADQAGLGIGVLENAGTFGK